MGRLLAKGAAAAAAAAARLLPQSGHWRGGCKAGGDHLAAPWPMAEAPPCQVMAVVPAWLEAVAVVPWPVVQASPLEPWRRHHWNRETRHQNLGIPLGRRN